MTTLAEINQTLQQQLGVMTEQGKSIEGTSDSIAAVKKNIASLLSLQKLQLANQKAARLDQSAAGLQAIEDKKEADKLAKKKMNESAPSGFMAGLGQGTGLSWLSNFMSGMMGSLFGKGGSLLGLLTGALGMAAGKLIKWGLIGSLIATYFSDEIEAVFNKIEEWTGIDLGAIFDENPALGAALTVAGGALAEWFAKSIVRWSASGFKSLAKIGAGLLGFGGLPEETPAGKKPAGKKGGAKHGGKPAAKPALKTGAAPKAAPKGKPPIRPGQATSGVLDSVKKLPKGFIRNAAGQVIEEGTGKFAKTEDVVDAIKKAGKFGKFGKLLGFLGAAGTVTEAMIDPAIAIYSGASDKEVKTQLVGALGSVGGATLGAAIGAAGVTAIPGIGQTGVANILGGIVGAVAGSIAGESLVEALAAYLLDEAPPKNLAMENFSENFDFQGEPAPEPTAPPAKQVPQGLSSRIAPSALANRYKNAPKAQQSTPTPMPSNTGSALNSAAGNVVGPTIINNITNNNTTGGGGSSTVMTVPVGTTDTSDRRDLIRRYGK